MKDILNKYFDLVFIDNIAETKDLILRKIILKKLLQNS